MGRYLLSVACLLLHARHGSGLGDYSTVDLIRSYYYDADEYDVSTDDGYILNLTRIRSSGTKPPVLMVHGVIAASDQWVLRGPDQDLAFILADQGHDVWLADLRGNFYSRRHKFLNESDPEFWDYSFHEIGLFDLPALIDKVLLETQYPQLYYVGHSMGTSVFFVLCSVIPEYNQKVKTAVLLAPIVFGPKKKMTPVMKILLQNVYPIANNLMKQNIYQFMPRTKQNMGLVDFVCADLNAVTCQLVITQLYGISQSHITTSQMRSYLKRLISGTSVKTMLHLSQIFIQNQFAMFDYRDAELNREFYSQDTPMPYPLEEVTCPVALFYGDNDIFVDNYSIQQLEEHLPNLAASISLPKYNHIDFMFAEDSPKHLYKRIVKLFSKS